MVLLPHTLRSDITRATFHALEGDAALVGPIAARVDAALARFDPSSVDRLSVEIGAALHRVAVPGRRQAANPLGRLLTLRRNARVDRLRLAADRQRVALAARQPALAFLLCCDPDPQVRAAALAALPEPPSPVHAALARHARDHHQRTE